MDWMLTTGGGGGPMVVIIPLGVYYNGRYETNPNCTSYLEVLNTKLNCDNNKTHSCRQNLGLINIVNSDLKHMLITCVNDQQRIFRLAVKLLAGLTIPVECLSFEEHPLTDSRFLKKEFAGHLSNAKEAFLDFTATKVLIDYIKLQHENNKLSSISSLIEEKECVGFILQLLRNILSAKERTPESNENQQMTASSSQRCNYTLQNQLIFNLFSQGFDQLLLDMLASYPQRNEWMTTIAQIIEILFEDQSVENIQNRLVGDSEYSGSDDESSMSSHEINTCESDGENMTSSLSWSSSSRRRRLTGQRETEYLPTDDNIFELLTKFIVELFMQNGFNTLVGNLYQQSLRNEDVKLNKDHQTFFYIIKNFMGYFSIIKTDVKHIKDALNIDILSYLTSEAVRETDKFEKLMKSQVNSESSLTAFMPRQLSSCVNAIREYLRVLMMNSSSGGGSRSLIDGSKESKGLEDWSNQLCVKLLDMQDLHKLFLLLLRQFNTDPTKKILNTDNRSFLCDILKTNHLLLLILKWAAEKFPRKNFDFKKHLQQFCSENILYQYGLVIEDFRENDDCLNECILTFLLHYLYDLGRMDLLYHLVIIRPISEIWKEKPEAIIQKNWGERIRRIYRFESNYHHGSGCDDRAKSHLGSIGGISELSDQEISQAMQSTSIYQFDDLAPNTVPIKEDIQSIISQLIRSGFREQLNWIQSSLLTTCSVKMGSYHGKEFCQPVACLSVRQNIPCPIVPWTEKEVFALRSARFVSVLHGLGLLVDTPQIGFYPCIPSEWSANILYDVALLLGHIDPQKLDFDQSRLFTKPDEESNCDPICDRSKGKFVDVAGSRSHIWGLAEDTESSKSLLPGVPSRVLQWVEQQSTNRVCWSPDEREDPNISALDQHQPTDEDGPFLETLSMEEMPLDDEMT